jgi:hypothetical protein
VAGGTLPGGWRAAAFPENAIVLDEVVLPSLLRRCLRGGVGPQPIRRLEHRGSLAVRGRKLAVIRTEEAHPAVAVVARAVLGHGALVDHGRTIGSHVRTCQQRSSMPRMLAVRASPRERSARGACGQPFWTWITAAG